MTRQMHGDQTRGFALVAALFLIVVLAGLGLVAIRLASSQQQTINLTVLGSRAQAAANSGIEFAANRAFQVVNGCAAINNTSISITQATLNGFSVQLFCSGSTHTVNGSAPGCPGNSCNVYVLTATSTYGVYGQPDYVSRSVSKTVSNVP